MRYYLDKLGAKIDACSLRERVLLLLCALAVVVGFWQAVVEFPQERQRAQLLTELERVQNAESAQVSQLAALNSASGDAGRRDQQAERDALQARLASLESELAALSHGLVSAEQLPRILQDVLISTTRLNLLRVQTLPVQELPLVSADTEQSPTGVYQHSVALQVSGTYFEVLDFLQTLERLPWRFYWDRLDYERLEYPLGLIDIRVYTLSAEEGLLGV